MARPRAQAPKSRVFIMPVRFVSRPRSDRDRTGARIKEAAFRNERMAAIIAMVLNFMISLDLSHCNFYRRCLHWSARLGCPDQEKNVNRVHLKISTLLTVRIAPGVK
jgi:hypothetical protein